MESLGVGVIGFGFIGKVHTYGYLNIPLFYNPVPLKTRLVGVATSKDSTAKAAAEQGGFEFGTSDWHELIERDDIQIINICSPNSQHVDQLLAAMKAGKHIYCDKPLIVSDEDAGFIADALADYHAVAQITLQYRFYPATLRAKQMIDDGYLGNIVSFRAAYMHSGSVDPSKPMGWKQLKSEGGGVLRDLGSHILDLMDHLIGPTTDIFAHSRILYPERPDGSGRMVSIEAEDQALMIVKLKKGAVGTIEATKIATGAEDELRFEIHGDKGALRFNLMDPNYLDFYSLDDPEAPLGGERGWRRIATVQKYEKPAGFPGPKFSIGWIRGHMHCLYSFLDSIANGRHAEPSFERGLHLHHMLSAAEKSAATSTWQKLPERKGESI
ncbi:Gfo/Idh/MocA family oxidoreductase [bacterium]|nr:Gfo/Idh/MocA family oxidoreductase [bacterium]